MSEYQTLRNSQITIDSLLSEERAPRKTKIVCTMGPSCWSHERLCQMIKAGMNVARLNFSHGDHAVHESTLQAVRQGATDLWSFVLSSSSSTLWQTSTVEMRLKERDFNMAPFYEPERSRCQYRLRIDYVLSP